MKVDYLPLNPNSNHEDVSFLLHNSRSQRSSQSQQDYNQGVKKIEKCKKSLKRELIFFFYAIIIAILYTVLLIMQIIMPEFFVNFYTTCPHKAQMAGFLELILLFFFLILMIYLLSLLEDIGTPNLFNIKIFFLGIVFFFVGVKISFIILYLNKRECYFFNLLEYSLSIIFKNFMSIMISFFMELALIFQLYWKFKTFLNLQQKEYKKILNI